MEIKIIRKQDKNYPKELLTLQDAPEKLYLLGNEKLLGIPKKIAIVGSRDCTTYGRTQATKFAKELSNKGVIIISGLAIGIDAAAHIGAANKTIAVIGSGLHKIYPQENQWLFYQILEKGGCIITEYAPETSAKSEYFPKRNRIISTLAKGVLVVEAKYRSGSTITANIAKKQGKPIFCIPSNIDSKNGIGTNRLLKQGAILVTEIEDILQNNFQSDKENNSFQTVTTLIKKEPKIQELSELQQRIYQEIEKKQRIHPNILTKVLKIPIATIIANLTIMELKGYIVQLPRK